MFNWRVAVQQLLQKFGYRILKESNFTELLKSIPLNQSEMTDVDLSNSENSVDWVLRDWFKSELEQILNQPPVQDFTVCDTCDTAINLHTAEQKQANCFITGLTLSRVVCPNCGLIFGPVALIQCGPEKIARLYQILYSFHNEGDTVLPQEKTFYLMNPSQQGVYLNYACGSWQTGIDRLLNAGWNVVGYEPYLPYQHARIATQLDALEQPLFDGIFTHNFLEHPLSIRASFKQFHQLLKADGLMAHSTPCYNYIFEESPFHLYFFTGRSIEALCEQTGFEQLQCFRQDTGNRPIEYESRLFKKCSG